MNTFGRFFRLTTFGESHGVAIGGVIDGCPAGIKLDQEFIHAILQRRRSAGGVSTGRQEEDQPHFISGLLDGITTGTPLAFTIANKERKSCDYDHLAEVYRPSHADYTYEAKYGIRDHRGGGRASARETVVRVVAGAIAMQILRELGIEITAYTSQLGQIRLPNPYLLENKGVGRKVGCPILEVDNQMYEALLKAREAGDSLGGVASVVVSGVPAGWGSPLYGKLDARLAEAMLGINACKGFEMGDGFELAEMLGSEANDAFIADNGAPQVVTNHSGGVQGGISNGAPILFRVAFKPIASIALPQKTINKSGLSQVIKIEGRHDGSVFPRVLPIIESMTALVLVDEMLAQRIVR